MTRLTDPEQVAELLGIPFSDEQLAAIAAPLEPGVIIAGAGSGKTTVMAARVVWLVGSEQVGRDHVLGLTFTRKAATELGARVAAALDHAGLGGDGGDDATELVATYDAFAGRLLNDYGLYGGIEPGMRLISGAERFRLGSRVVARAAGPFAELGSLSPATVTKRLLDLSAELRSHLVTPEAVERQADSFLAALDGAPSNSRGNVYKNVAQAAAAVRQRLELLTLVRDYEAVKAELGYCEFADQMAWAAELAADVSWLPEAVRTDYQVVLLDEYQDTSAAQAVLLRRLFSGPDPERGRGHPVTAVGDPCQAIYGWRGAATSNIGEFSVQFPCADGTPAASYQLTVNRRSGPRILALANDIAVDLSSAPLAAPPGTPPGHVSTRSSDTWQGEVSWLGDEIVTLHDTGRVGCWKDIAVLARRNSQIADIYAHLTAIGVPAEIVGVGGLLDVPAVADVVATLRVLGDPLANPAVVRLLTSAHWAIGQHDLALLGRRAAVLVEGGREPGGPAGRTDASDGASLLEAAFDPGDAPLSDAARERLGAFTAEIARLRRWMRGSLTDLVAQVIAALAVDVELLAQGDSAACLSAFTDVVASYDDVDPEASLTGLLAYLDAERDEGVGLEQPVVSGDDSVKLLTVHRAKGLEWPVVFMPGVAAGVFPTGRTSTFLSSAAAIPAELRGDAAAVPQVTEVTSAGLDRYAADVKQAERLAEDRLAYVAVTRAAQQLYVSTHRWAAGLTRPRLPSPYFDTASEHAGGAAVVEPLSEENPLVEEALSLAWPDLGDGEAAARRREAAAWVSAGIQPPDDLNDDDRDAFDHWAERARALIDEARDDERRRRLVVAPDYLSVTALATAVHDPAAYAARLALPVPRLVDYSARTGTDVHQWLERRFTVTPALDDLLDDEAAAVPDRWAEAFAASPYADAVPVAVETSFTLTLAGRVVRGRIDAVFPGRDGFAYQVVDWKTGDARQADPLQLACYRLAWAELTGVDPASVDAVFYDLRNGRVVRPEAPLPGRTDLERLMSDL